MQKASKSIEIYVFCSFLILLFIFSFLHLHGFAFSKWHEIIDGSKQTEILFGKAPALRSDDWLVNIPHCIAQIKDIPPFRKYNSLIGDGRYNMIISGAAPVLDITTLFRPHIWGYFFSPDFGMAFEWWFKVLGLAFTWWILIRRLTNNDIIAVLSTLVIAFSPFLQTWSFNCSPSIVFAIGTFIAFLEIKNACNKYLLWLSAFCFSWFLTAFLLTFYYMPYLVTLAYLVLFMTIGFICSKKSAKKSSFSRISPVIASFVTVGAIMCYVVIDNYETIELIKHSEYPGKRVSSGGNMPIEAIFRGNVLSFKPPHNWAPLNRCEGSSFMLFFPLTVSAIIYESVRRKKLPDCLAIALIFYIGFIIFYNIYPLPEVVAKITLMERVTPIRTLLALGIADLLLFSIYAAKKQSDFSLSYVLFAICMFLLWALFLFVLAKKASLFFHNYDIKYPLYGALLMLIPSILLFFYPKIALLVLSIFSFYFTFDTNPVARGGFKFVEKNQLSKKICELSTTFELYSSKKPMWLVYDTLEMPTFLRMLGVKAINGLHAYPQTNLWSKLDPNYAHQKIYNRYAHNIFLVSETSQYEFILVHNDLVVTKFYPSSDNLKALNIDFILCKENTSKKLDQLDHITNIFTYAGHCIYKVKD